MNERKLKLNVGLFVGASLLLLLVMLFFFGLSEIFVRKAYLTTSFSESVQGLSVGSAVKYRGVQIGTVKNITILVAQKAVRVDMTIDLERFIGRGGSGGSETMRLRRFNRFIKSEMSKGLRCRLEFVGITGMKYIDMDYFAEPGEVPPPPEGVMDDDKEEARSVYITSVSSSFKDIAVALTGALERLSKVRFENISDELERTLREFGSILGDPALKATIERVSEAAGHLEESSNTISRVLSEERLESLVKLLENDLRSIDELAKKLTTVTTDMKLAESSAAFRDAAEAMSEARREFSNTLMRLNSALDAFRQLCEQVNYDPGFIFGGKRRTPDSL